MWFSKVYECFKMKSVCLLDLLVMVAVTFCVVKVSVSVNPTGQHGDRVSSNVDLFTFSPDSILLLRSTALANKFPANYDSFPAEIKISNDFHSSSNPQPKRKRKGHRGGLRRRLRKSRYRLPLPSIILANTRSIRPKPPNFNFDSLCANVAYMHEYRNASIICLTETWLCDKIQNDSLAIPGFGVPLRQDRDLNHTSKHGGGGVLFYVNEQFCNPGNIVIRKKITTEDFDLLSISLRPKYLPREFGQVFLTAVYPHPGARVNDVNSGVAEIIRSLQSLSPDAPNFVMGDFNHCELRSILPALKQYVTCPTRLQNTLDKCYGNIPNAYKSVKLPPIGQSDHNAIQLVPAYVPKVKREPVVRKTVQVWNEESVNELNACFESTDWQMFLDSSDDVSIATDVISDYIVFCVESIIPTKEIKIFPNNKPWITRSLKATLNEKKLAFQTGDRVKQRTVQKKLKGELRKGMLDYKDKVQREFERGQMRDVWKGIKILTGQGKYQSSTFWGPIEEREDFAEKLNTFYCRFERPDLHEELSSVISDLERRMKERGDCDDWEVSEEEVEFVFSKLNVRKACGPDCISGRVLRSCYSYLSFIFSQLFSWSLKDCIVPSVWKKSIISPVPKNKSQSSLNDFRPVALTSIVMKCFERIVLKRLLSQTQSFLDPFQFAYKPNRSTDDATLTLLHNCYSHLENPGSFVRILFIDFSSAFNTIQPHLMALKLLSLDVNPNLILWITQFLINRTQSVRFQQAISSIKTTSTGSPQGTVLSPILFTLFTNDCSGTDSSLLIKYSDDSAILDLSNSHSSYQDVVTKFSDWCKQNFLELNVKKTKELVVDFRRTATDPIPDLFIDSEKIERVDQYKYLGTIIDKDLNFNANTHAINKKCQSRLYCLQKLRSLNMKNEILSSFYRCFLESVLTFGFVCWFGGLSVSNRNVLERVVRVSGKVIGERLCGLNELYERRVVRKGCAIVRDSSHVLAKYFDLLPSGRRYRVVKCKRQRYNKSFVNRAIHFMNNESSQ